MSCITFSFEGFADNQSGLSSLSESWRRWRLKALLSTRIIWQLWFISGIPDSSRAGNKQFLTAFKIYLYQALHHFDFMIHVFTEIYRTTLIASSCSRLIYPGRYWQNLNLLFRELLFKRPGWVRGLEMENSLVVFLVFFLGFSCEFEYQAVWILQIMRWV